MPKHTSSEIWHYSEPDAILEVPGRNTVPMLPYDSNAPRALWQLSLVLKEIANQREVERKDVEGNQKYP